MESRKEVTIFSTFYKGQEEVNVLRTEELNRPKSVNDDKKKRWEQTNVTMALTAQPTNIEHTFAEKHLDIL